MKVMLKLRLVRVVGLVMVLGLIATASTSAWLTPRHTSYLTFSDRFALPGVSLPAGTYIFELAAPESRTDVVRVMSRDGSRVYLTAFTRTVARPAGLRSDRQIVLHEVPLGTTPPLRTWFPIGEAIGHEFIYAVDGRQLGTRASN
jgi:hypothetical protein